MANSGLERDLKRKDEKIAELLARVDDLRQTRASEVSRLSERAEALEQLLVQADVLPVDATAREHEVAKQQRHLADQVMWKKELEKQRGKLQTDLYGAAKDEARTELQSEGFYMPNLQPVPVGGRVLGFQRVAVNQPPQNYFSAKDKDRVGIRYRPGAVPAHMSVLHDGAPSQYTYVGDMFVDGGPQQHRPPQMGPYGYGVYGGMPGYPQGRPGEHGIVVPTPMSGGSSFFRELAGLPGGRSLDRQRGWEYDQPYYA